VEYFGLSQQTHTPTSNTLAQPTSKAHNTHKMFSGTNASTTSNNNLSSPFQLLNAPTKLNNVGSLIPASSHQQQKREAMPHGYVPSDSDVCCGRGKVNWNMTGNVNFRKLVHASVAQYMQAPLKKEKTAVVVSVVDKIRRQGGRFLKQQQKDGSSDCWFDIGDTAARSKVGHSLRDQVGRSVSEAKSRLRQANKEQKRRAADAIGDCDFDSAAGSTASWWI
jgi:hypothetical protein